MLGKVYYYILSDDAKEVKKIKSWEFLGGLHETFNKGYGN